MFAKVKAKQLPKSRKSSFYGLYKGFLNRRPIRRTGFNVRKNPVRKKFAGIIGLKIGLHIH